MIKVRERWSEKHNCKVKNAAVDRFIDDILEVYRKHGLAIGHEDSGGAFIVEKLNPACVKWLEDALDGT